MTLCSLSIKLNDVQIPQIQYLKSQSFKSDKIEFVWQFPQNEQFILWVNIHNEIYLQYGKINNTGKYILGYNEMCLINVNLLNLSQVLTDESRWPKKRHPKLYNMFTNGVDLISLVNESIEFLKT